MLIMKYTYCEKSFERMYSKGDVKCLFNVKINDISVIYETAHECAIKHNFYKAGTVFKINMFYCTFFQNYFHNMHFKERY